MRRLLKKVILPAAAISMWILLSSLICRQADDFNFFLFWIIAGVPFGIRRMCIWLVPWNYGISSSIGVLALNLVIGGLIGGFVLLTKIILIGYELIMTMAEIVTGRNRMVAGR